MTNYGKPATGTGTRKPATERHVFPGGVYKVPQTIFNLLEDEGIVIPEELKYFPYRATFDFECYFKKEDQHPKNTAKLTWEAEHVPLSVSVCSNVPGYDEPKCFVSSGNTREMLKQFIDYLVEISQESYSLLLDRFSDVFDQISQRIANSEVCCVFEHLGIFETCTYYTVFRYVLKVARINGWKKWCNVFSH